jgi:hypothetical protein
MTDEFRKERAMTVRAMAEKADPFTKKRLLALAAKYALAQSHLPRSRLSPQN